MFWRSSSGRLFQNQLQPYPEPSEAGKLLPELVELFPQLTDKAISGQGKYLSKLHPKTFQKIRSDRFFQTQVRRVSSPEVAVHTEDFMELSFQFHDASNRPKMSFPMGRTSSLKVFRHEISCSSHHLSGALFLPQATLCVSSER